MGRAIVPPEEETVNFDFHWSEPLFIASSLLPYVLLHA